MRKLFFFLCIWGLMLTGCGDGRVNSAGTVSGEEAEEVAASQDISFRTGEMYTMYAENSDYTLSMYEPREGCYLGAYILSNNRINFDISEYETVTEKKHALYMYTMQLGGTFPTRWFLGCLSLMKTPYVTITAPNEYNPFDTSMLEKAAKELAEFYVPVFVDFYPNPESKGYNAEEYVAFFQEARRVFRENASNVAFIWSVGQEEAASSRKYYPGNEFVDWVGIQIYQTINEDGAYGSDAFTAVDYMYYMYQRDKPLMISNYAVSHFSNLDNVYRTRDAADEIRRFYARIVEDYPRIKAVNYMDFSSIEVSRERVSGDNFAVTDNDIVKAQYVESIAPVHYLSDLDFSSTGDTNMELFRSPFPVYKIDNEFFISNYSVQYDLKINGIAGFTNKKEIISGQNFYDLHTLVLNNVAGVSYDEDKRRVVIRIPHHE